MCVHLLTDTPFIILHRLLCITYVAWALGHFIFEKTDIFKKILKISLFRYMYFCLLYITLQVDGFILHLLLSQFYWFEQLIVISIVIRLPCCSRW